MTRQEELILKIIHLAEERMKLIMMTGEDIDWDKINRRIDEIPLEVDKLKKELMSLKEADDNE